MHRLFVALRPPPDIRLSLSATMAGVPTARWQDDAHLHLTLRYVGPVERPVAEDLAVALAAIHAPAPKVALAGVGRFEKRGRTDSLWAGIAPRDALTHLHHKVEQAVRRVGLPADPRAFLPHITVARLARGAGVEHEIAGWLLDHAALASPAFTLPHLVLYESHLGSEGATYDAIARWPLDPPPRA
ncbi:2'-5' RNA ligase [Sphingomonas sp. Leaf17]|uniref:RNA 2',3'-cyclic phosphodiesterase n=1 Tax=Sphingomonas sp. Leaf17 TaxID=1735683 RepID=UPI0006FEC42B|nr:RNA 2',3'-cyclic phosphodiesterase [Sphingomonas sp. Leaf17]KQM63442.1 2'-5' RNA ligase [Sphingomonas sp. Leaf17]